MPAPASSYPPGERARSLVGWILTLLGALAVAPAQPLPPPQGFIAFSSPNYGVGEGAGLAVITLTRTGGSSGAIVVSFETSDATATAGVDYTAVSQYITFESGETMKAVDVPLLEDLAVEGNESVNLRIFGHGLPSEAALTIADNDVLASLSGIPTLSRGGLFLLLAALAVAACLRLRA